MGDGTWKRWKELTTLYGDRHTLILGVPEKTDLILYSGRCSKEYKLDDKTSHKFSYECKKEDEEITAVVAYDRWGDGTGGFAELTKGGVGKKEVEIEVTSQLYRGFSFEFVVFGDRDSLQQQALAKAMSEGGGNLLQSNIIMHGPPGAGKSSLKRVILGQSPLPKEKQNSTKIVENAVRAVCTDRLYQFEVIDNDQMIDKLAAVVGDLSVNEHPKVQQSQATLSHKENMNNPPLFVYDDDDLPDIQISDASVALRSINNKLKHVSPSAEMFNSQWYHLIDSGGQPQFSDILPLVYHSPSLNIIVIRLTDGLDTKPKVTFHSQGRDVYDLPDKLRLTNREFIIRMCQTAASCAKSGGPVPFVMIVGTHKDELGSDGDAKIKIKQINKELKSVCKEFEDLLICKSDDETIFDINTMATGKDREQYTKELQEKISGVVEESAVPHTVPLKWLAFQLDLDKGEGVVRMAKCYEGGKALGMGEANVKNALMYFDRAALLMYFPDDLPDLVLTKVDPLIDRLSKLVKASFKSPRVTLRFETRKLRETGLFDKAFLSKVFSKMASHGLHDEEFLKLLECLKIAVHVKGDEYFLPSTLSFEPPSQVRAFKMCCTPIAFSWKDRILPHGFFFTVAVELLSKEDGVYSFILCEDIAQWREEIQVSEREQKIPGVVKLTDRKKWIQVSYSGHKSYCPKVHHAVDTATQRAVDRFQHTGIGSPVVRYLCPLHSEQVDHYCYLSDNRCFITCSLNASETGPVTSDMLCWIPDSTGITQKCTPKLKDVHDLLKSKSNEWDTIGQGLGVEHNNRQGCLKEGIMTTDGHKLESVLNSWIETQCSEVSWDHLIEVLTNLEFVDIAKNVKTYLQTDLSAIRKYYWGSSA